MEKTGNTGSLIRIVITGPESTGKTVLAERLARHYNAPFIPEYARDYIQQLNRKYNVEDVEKIAFRQVELEKEYSEKADSILFYDTYLIITKIWLEVVFKKHLEWIDDMLKERHIDRYLLCYPDIPWEADPVRENGGIMREILFEKYRLELESYQLSYRIIKGESRFDLAVESVNELINTTRNG